MATTAEDITVAEFGRLETYLDTQRQLGQRRFTLEEVARRATLDDGKVYEAMAHLERKYEYVENVGAGVWIFDEPA